MAKRLFLIITFLNMFVLSLLGQNLQQQIYRIYITAPQQMKVLMKSDFELVGENFGNWLDIRCSEQTAARLANSGLVLEKLAASERSQAHQSTFEKFHDYKETTEFLHNIAQNYSSITRLDSIGTTIQNRVLWALKISDNPESDEDEPCLLIEGCIHGNENHALEACLFFIKYMVENYGTNQEVTYWVDNREIWVVPLVNPDGHEAQRRYNANNVDLNRNFGYWWGFTASRYGVAPFSEPETRAIRDLAIRIKPYGSLAFHTSGRVILYPWAYTSSPVAPDDALFQQVAAELADSINAVDPTIQYNFRRSGTWYWHGGEHNDWMYSQYGMLSFTIELMTSQSAPPSDHENEVVLPAFRVMLRKPDQSGISGRVLDGTSGLPQAANFKILEIFDATQLQPRMCDSSTGRFIRFLPEGNFTLEIYEPGYTKFVKQIVVSKNSPMQYVDVNLYPGADLVVSDHFIYDGGSGSVIENGILNRGESAQLNFKLKNIGSFDAQQVIALVTSQTAALHLSENELIYGDIQAGEEKLANQPIHANLEDSVMPGQKLPLLIEIQDYSGNYWSHLFELRVQGFSDDMETEGRDQWTHGTVGDTPNSHDDWQYGKPNGESSDPVSAHSGNFVWGNDLGSGSFNGAYQNNQHNFLRSRAFSCLGWQNVYLQFYRFLRILGGDEAYIKVNDTVIWSNLNQQIIDDTWNLQIIDISQAAANLDSVVISFYLKSNSSGKEGGWTIDDIVVDEQILLAAHDGHSPLPKQFHLLPNFPNPFQDVTQIRFSLTRKSFIDVSIFNVLGQKVKTIVQNELLPGNYVFPWDGTDKNHNVVSSGVYLIQLKADKQVLSNKILYVRDD